MTEMLVDFLPEDQKIFRPAESLGEAMRAVAQAIAPSNTAKTLQRRWRIDHATAEKINQPCLSGRHPQELDVDGRET